MSSHSLTELRDYARSAIKNIIPLDDQSIDEMIQYTLANFKSREAMSNHFLDILGPSDLTFQFVTKFTDMVFGSPSFKPEPVKSISTSVLTPVLKPAEKPASTPIVSKPKSSGIRLVKTKLTNDTGKNNRGRMANNSKKGSTTSEMFDLKPKTVEVQKAKSKEVKKKLDSIEDLDEVLLQLELNENSNSGDIKVCNCNATRHPLFEMYPNCLNCGKIICEREGLQPCSFCGKSLISEDDMQQMKEVITRRKEELEIDTKAGNSKSDTPKLKRKNVMKITLNTPGQNNFKVQEQFYKKLAETEKQKQEIEEQKKEEQKLVEQTKKELDYYKSIHKKDEDLIKAEERLATLLNFQDNGAERTKIIDNASDFDIPSSGGSLWASPIERVLQFKRQQKQQKKMQDADLRRSGRGETMIDVEIQNGKVVFTDKSDEPAFDKDISDDEEIAALQKQANEEKLAQFHKDVQNVYDFDSFDKSLFKPIYKSTEVSNSIDTSMKDIIAELPELGKVVQLGDAETQESQIFNMIGV